MSKTVDERVVSMRFDNQQFERGVRQTSDSLQKFKEKFNFRQQETEFDRLQGLVNTFSLTHMASELSNLGDRFGLFGTIAGRALENITDKAMSTVGNLIDQLGIGFGGIKDGFAEYELQINSVQTMLANMGRESESTADTMMMSAGRISSSLQEMATQVVRGDWGNGQDRIEALGQYYQQIQDAVNDAWAAGGKVPEGWEKGLETITGEIVVAAEDAGEAIEGIGDATMTAEERNRKNLEKIEHNLGILNEYADKTVYTFSDMTNAIGQFMTAGVDLDTSTQAIQGLSNIAAAFGVDNNRLKNTFYQLSQAINSGKVQLIDWRSVINANMSGPLFRDEIINTAKEMGALIDTTNMSEKEFQSLKDAAHDAGKTVADLSDVQQDFNGSLRSGWFTADILTSAISKFTSSGLAEYFEETTGVAKDYGEELINAYLDAEDATESQNALNKAIEEFSKSGEKGSKEVQNYIERLKNVTDAATKVKSVTQLIQVIREGIGTGWADTFKIVIGDFYEAQDLFTGISNKVNGFINDVANARNKILQEWKEKGGRNTLIETLGKIFDFTDADSIIYNLIKPIKDALLEVFNLEGFNSDNLVNATNKFKAIVENVAKFIKDHYEEIKGIVKLVAVYFRLKFNMFMAKVKLVLFLLKLFSPVLKVIFEVVGRVAGALGNLLNQSSGISGIISGMTDAFNGLGNSLSSISGIKLPDLSGFTDKLGLGSINLSGLGSVGDTISQFVGGIAGADQNMNAAEETVNDAQQLLDETQDVAQQASDVDTEKIDESTEKIVKSSKKQRKAADTILDSVKSIKSKLAKAGDKDGNSVAGTMSKAVKSMADAIGGIKNTSKNSKIDPATAKEIVSDLEQKKESIQQVGQALSDFFYVDKEAFKKALNLPEKGGFWTLLQKAYEWLKNNFDSIIEIIRLITTYKLLKSLTEVFSGIADVGAALAGMFKNFGKAAKKAASALKIEALSKLVLNLSISIGILVAAVAGLTALDTNKLWGAILALGAIVAIFVSLTYVATKINAMDTGKIVGLALFLITFGTAIAILVAAIKSLSKLQPEQIAAGVIGIIALIAGLITAIDHIKMDKAQHINKVAGTILALSVSILLLGAAIKSFAKMDAETFYSGLIRVALGLVVFTKAMQGIQSSAKENTKSAGTLIALSVALLLLGSAIKKFSKMDPETFYRGLVRVALGLIALAGAVRLLNTGSNTSVFEKGQKIFNPVMRTLLALSAAMLVLSLVLKVIASIPIEKALPAAGILVGLMLTLSTLANLIMTFSRGLGEHSGKNIGKTLLSFAGALLVLSIVVKILGSLSIKEAIQGAILITALMGELTVSFAVISQAGKPNAGTIGSLITIAIVIAVLSIVIKSLAKLDFANAMGAVAEVGTLLGGLAAVMLSISESTKITKKGDLVAGVGLFFLLAAIGAALGYVIAEFSNKIQNPVAAIALAGAVTILIGAMAGVLIAIAAATKIGINEAEIASVGALLAALTIAVAGLALAVGAISNITNPTNVIPLATAVSELLLAMIPVFAAIASISKASILISPGEILAIGVVFDILASLFTFSLAGVLAAIGAIPWGPAIDNGLEILKNIGKKLGEAIGGFIEAISIGMLHAAENIAKGLEAVFGQITSLVDSLHGKVDDNSVEMVKSVVRLIAVMTASDFIDALTSWFTTKIIGGKKSNISDRIKDLGVGIAELQKSMNGVDYYKLKELVGVFEAISHVLAAISGVILSSTYSDLMDFFSGGKKKDSAMKELSDGLKEFVQNGFISSIRILNEQIPDYKADTVAKKVEMLGTFAEALKPLQEIMPRTTSLVSVIVGQADNDWGKLGESLGDFIKHMTAAVMVITADVTTDADGNQVKAPNDAKFDAAARRLQTISGFSNSFSAFDTIRGNTPSLKGFIFGDKMDWGDFGRSLTAFICSMNTAVHTLTDDVVGNDAGETVSKPDEAKFTEAGRRLGIIQGFTNTFKEYAALMPDTVTLETAFGKFQVGTDWTTFGHDLENFVGSLVEIVRVMNQEHLVGFDLKIGIAVRRFTDIGELTSTLKKFSEVQIPSDGFLKTFHQLVTGEGGWTLFGEDLKKFMPNLISAIKVLATDDGWYGKDEDRSMSVDELIDQAVKRSGKLERLGKALSLYADFVVTMAGKGETITQAITKHDPIAALSGTPLLQEDTRADQTILQRTGSTLENFFTGVIQIAKTIADNGEFIDKFIDEGQAPERLDKLSSIADPLKNFINAFVDIDAEGGETAGKNIKSILEAFSTPLADNEVSGLESFATSFTSFIEQLKVLGTSVELDKYEGKIDKSISLLERVSKIRFTKNSLQISELGSALYTIGQGIRNFSTFVNDPEVDKATQSGIYNTVTTFISDLNTSLATGNPTFDQTGKDYHTSLLNGLSTNLDIDFKEAINKAVDFVTNGSDNGWKSLWVEAFEGLGKQLAAGLARGMEDSGALENIANAAVKMVNEAKNATETAAKIESPSKVMASLGKYIPLGFAKGIGDRSSLRAVEESAVKMAKAVEGSTKEYLEIHSPSQVMKTLGEYTVQGFIDGLQNGIPKVQEVAKMIADSISKIPSTVNNEQFATKVLGKVSKTAVAGLARVLSDASSGTVSFEDATKTATNSVFKFAAALYAETDAFKEDKKELEELEVEREKAYKKQSEEQERWNRESAKAADYRESRLNEALGSIGNEDVQNQIRAYIDRIRELKKELNDPNLRDMDKVLIQDELDRTTGALDGFIETLDDTKNEGEKSFRDIAKEAKDAGLKIDETVDNVTDTIQKDLEDANKSVDDINTQIADKNQQLIDKILKQWTEYRNKIRDSVKSFLNIFSGESFKIDLFADTKSQKEQYQEERNSKVDEVTKAEEDLKAAEEELLEAQRELAEAQQRSANVEGRSLIALNDIEEATNRVTEAEQKRAEAQEALANTQKTLADYDAENSAEGIGKKMLETMGKNIDAYHTFDQNLKALAQMGLDPEYLADLRKNGMSSAEQVAKLFAAASSETMGIEFRDKFNDYIQQQRDIQSETYKQSLEDKINRAKEWTQNLATLRKAGLDEGLIKEIIDNGPDNSELMDILLHDVENGNAEEIKKWNELYVNLDSTSNAIADAVTTMLTEEAKYAESIVNAILRTNGGNAPIDLFGKSDILNKLLASDESMGKLYAETALKEYNRLLESGYKGEGKDAIMVKAYSKALEAVNLAVNEINRNTNGAYALQYGLIEAMPEAVSTGFKDSANALSDTIATSNAKAVADSASTTATTFAETTGSVIGEAATQVTDNQALALETENKEVVTANAIYRRMEEVRIAIVNAIYEHLRSMRSWLNAINLQVKGGFNSIVAKAGYIENAIESASSAICSAISNIKINSQIQPQPTPSEGSSNKYTGTPNSTVTITEGTSTNGSTITRTYDDTGTLVKETGKITKVVKGVMPAAKKAGEAVGQAYGNGIATGTKKSLGIKSPSRVFMEIGKFVDLGFAKGVKDNTPKVAAALSALGNFNPNTRLLDFGIQNGNLLDFGTTQNLARGISPNSAVSVERLMRDFLANQHSAPSNTDNSTTTNNFNITSNNPKEVAYEVDKILQKRTMQRRNAWA